MTAWRTQSCLSVAVRELTVHQIGVVVEQLVYEVVDLLQCISQSVSHLIC